MKKPNRPDPFAKWKAALAAEISAYIARARRQQTTAMSEDSLRQCVRTPPGGPTGTNAAYYYKTAWFPEALASLKPSDRRFIIRP